MPRRSGTRPLRAIGAAALPTPVPSNHTTPLSSAYPSTYASEVEWDPDDEAPRVAMSALSLEDSASAGESRKAKSGARKTFRFLDLPSELRVKVYAYYFSQPETNRVLDLDPDNYRKGIHKKLGLLRTCRTIYREATYWFYSSHTFRVFPTCPGRFFKTKKPLLARLKPHQRSLITSLELRLGPGWNNPPRGWVVNSALGLADCINLRKITVFVEFDPSDGVFNGFRVSDGFYEGFSRNLLSDVLSELPSVASVTFDAWSSVKKSGAMMRSLLDITVTKGWGVRWGPERGWTDAEEENLVGHAHAATARLNAAGLDVLVLA